MENIHASPREGDDRIIDQYEAEIPITRHGLLLKIGETSNGSTAFIGYTKCPDDGSAGPSETGNLVRAVGDRIVAVDGVDTAERTYEEVVRLLLDRINIGGTEKKPFQVGRSVKLRFAAFGGRNVEGGIRQTSRSPPKSGNSAIINKKASQLGRQRGKLRSAASGDGNIEGKIGQTMKLRRRTNNVRSPPKPGDMPKGSDRTSTRATRSVCNLPQTRPVTGEGLSSDRRKSSGRKRRRKESEEGGSERTTADTGDVRSSSARGGLAHDANASSDAANCTTSSPVAADLCGADPLLLSQYPKLCNLGVPLGDAEDDRRSRDAILCELQHFISFKESRSFHIAREISVHPMFQPVGLDMSMGDAEVQRMCPMLTRLGVPLGGADGEASSRGAVLREIFTCNEHHHLPTRWHSSNGRTQAVVKIPWMDRGAAYDGLIRNLRRENFMDTFLKGLTPSTDLSADILCAYFAKRHNSSFLKALDLAKEIETKEAKARGDVCTWHAKILREAPPDLVMHDGGRREEANHVGWNMRYEELLTFKLRYGDCFVPIRKKTKDAEDNGGENSDGKRECSAGLSKWVSYQRTNYRMKNPSLTARRIELLESIGFSWEGRPGYNKISTDPRFHRAIAAKLYFNSNLTAREAMLLGGLDEERASDDSTKKHVNAIVCTWCKKKSKMRKEVETIISLLSSQELPEGERIRCIFGDTEICAQLQEQNKLVPRWREQRGDDNNGDVTSRGGLSSASGTRHYLFEENKGLAMALGADPKDALLHC